MLKPKPRTMNPDAKRSAIMAAAEILFAKKGFAGTTMADIAGQADVAVGTLYRLFPDKLALLVALHDAMEARFIDAMQAGWVSVEQDQKRFAPMIDALMDEVATAGETMSLYMLTRDIVSAQGSLPGTKTIAAIEGQYAQGVLSGAFHPHHLGTAAAIAYGMVEGAMRAWMAEPTDLRRAEITQELKTVFNRAFLKP